jgi:hypothetical protein
MSYRSPNRHLFEINTFDNPTDVRYVIGMGQYYEFSRKLVYHQKQKIFGAYHPDSLVPLVSIKQISDRSLFSELTETSSEPASFSTGPASFSTGPASFSTGPASFSTGPASFSTGPASFSTGPANFSTGPAEKLDEYVGNKDYIRNANRTSVVRWIDNSGSHTISAITHTDSTIKYTQDPFRDSMYLDFDIKISQLRINSQWLYISSNTARLKYKAIVSEVDQLITHLVMDPNVLVSCDLCNINVYGEKCGCVVNASVNIFVVYHSTSAFGLELTK